MLMSHWPLSLWPGAVLGGLKELSPSPNIAQHVQWLPAVGGQCCLPSVLSGHTDFPPPPLAILPAGTPEPNQVAVCTQPPFRHALLAGTRASRPRAQQGVGQEGLYLVGLALGLGGPHKRHSEATRFQPRTTSAELTCQLANSLGPDRNMCF